MISHNLSPLAHQRVGSLHLTKVYMENVSIVLSAIGIALAVVSCVVMWFCKKMESTAQKVWFAISLAVIVIFVVVGFSYIFCFMLTLSGFAVVCKFKENLSLTIAITTAIVSTTFTVIGAICNGDSKRQQDEENKKIADALKRIEDKLSITNDINAIKYDLKIIKQSRRPFLCRLLSCLCNE